MPTRRRASPSWTPDSRPRWKRCFRKTRSVARTSLTENGRVEASANGSRRWSFGSGNRITEDESTVDSRQSTVSENADNSSGGSDPVLRRNGPFRGAAAGGGTAEDRLADHGDEELRRGLHPQRQGVHGGEGRLSREVQALVCGQTRSDRARIHRRGRLPVGGIGEALRDLHEERRPAPAGRLARRAARGLRKRSQEIEGRSEGCSAAPARASIGSGDRARIQ